MPATAESDVQEVPGEFEYPTRMPTEFGTNWSPLPNTVIDVLPLDDPEAGAAEDTTAQSNALVLTKDPCRLWTDSMTVTDTPLA